MPFSGLTLVTPPLVEPVSVADVKKHMRITQTAEDSLIAGYITAARGLVQEHLRRALITQTWRMNLDDWPDGDTIEIPLPPLQSISSFTYRDSDNTQYTMSAGYTAAVRNYTLDTDSEPARITLPYSGVWPAEILKPAGAISITFVAGWPAYSGTVTVTSGGAVTKVSGDDFTDAIVGTWMTIDGVSYAVASRSSATACQLASAPAGAIASPKAYTANAVPMPIRQAICLLVGQWFEYREPLTEIRAGSAPVPLPFTVDALLAPYRALGYTG